MQAVIERPPPPDLSRRDSGGSGDRWVRLFRAQGDIEAHLLSGRLNAAGIETGFLRTLGGAAWMHGGADPFAPVDILVKSLQFEDARLVLAEIAYEQPFEPRSRPVTTWKTALVWWSAALALGLAFTGIALARTSEQFTRCGLSLTCEDSGARP